MYTLSIGFLASALFLLALRLHKFNDARYHASNMWQSLIHVMKQPAIYHAVIAQWILRFFYAWMVIYTPLYLYRDIGFDWAQIGIMFSIMLLPFLIFELPLGKMADTFVGEKVIMVGGFILLIGSVFVMPFLNTPTFWLWTAVLFISRVGAASIEITTESYFFRRVDSKAADTISVFRMARPATYLAAASIAALSLQFITLQWSFMILGLVCIIGLIEAFRLPSSQR
jgi:MFS family permease